MQKLIAAAAAIAGLASAASAAITVSHVKTIDLAVTADSLGASFIGSNPSAIAWNGTDLYVGGYNQSGAAANTGIVRISNALGSESFGPTFGTFSTNNLRGLTSLAFKNGTLAASLDNGAGNVNSIRAFDSSGSQLWATGGSTPDATRRGNGVAFDPGFNGAGTNQGVAYLSIGSGRRHVMNAATGVYINGQNSGAIINFATATTTWRDLDFNPATGDLYMREANRVGKAVRSGDNSFVAPSTQIFLTTAASAVDNQNLAFAASTAYGNFIIFNDRSTAAAGQSFAAVVKAIDTNGVQQVLDFGTFTAPNGNGAYDFSFDAATQTLAISDFANRQVHIFAVPAPGAAVLLGLTGLVATRRRR